MPSITVPVPLTPLVGRRREVAEVRALLDLDDTHLLTLTGSGGMGKTRLALEVASQVQDEFVHGACFVSLASIRDPDLVPFAVGRALGIRQGGDRSVTEMLEATLRARHLLLVLDNMEQVVAAASWLAELMRACPRVKVLVTSRTRLRIDGEMRFLVQPLALPESGAGGALDEIRESAAVELFVQRARSVRHGFTLNPDNADTILRICRELDGLPLAIELAAAWIGVLSPREILARLVDRLGLLRDGWRDAPPRHRTMRDAIAWSHGLLSYDEQRLFRRLAVFTGGFTLEAAEAVGAVAVPGDGSDSILKLVIGLVEHNLIRQMPGMTGENRFAMLEVIRQFALEQLEGHGETPGIRDAHAAWYLRMAGDSESAVEGEGQVSWLDRLEREHDNIREVLDWLTVQERIDEALDLAGSIRFFWLIRGHYLEARQRYEVLLAYPALDKRTVVRAKALNGLGFIASRQGDPDAALAAFDEAIPILRDHGDNGHLSWALAGLAHVHYTVGRNQIAETCCIEAMELATELRYLRVMGVARDLLGTLAARRGDTALAMRHLEDSLALSRTGGDRWGIAIHASNLGAVVMAAGDTVRAESLWRESVALVNELGDRRNLPNSLMALADIARNAGDVEAAESYLNEALAAGRDIGDSNSISNALIRLASLALDSCDLARSMIFLRGSVETRLQVKNQRDLAQCMDGFADLANAIQDFGAAARFVGIADGMLDRNGYVRVDLTPDAHHNRLAAMVAILGQLEFRKAWSGGWALTLDEAIAEALAFEIASKPGRLFTLSLDRDGDSVLTPRELDVLTLMAAGMTNRQIADRLSLSHRTVTTHASHILGKLGLSSRTQVVAYAVRNGLT